MAIENPKAAGFPRLKQRCKECALINLDDRRHKPIYGCDDVRCSEPQGFMYFVPYSPPTPETLNGCERCIHCPAGAKKGDTCPATSGHVVGDVNPSWNAKMCIEFVLRSCQNCGLLPKIEGKGCGNGCEKQSKWIPIPTHQLEPIKEGEYAKISSTKCSGGVCVGKVGIVVEKASDGTFHIRWNTPTCPTGDANISCEIGYDKDTKFEKVAAPPIEAGRKPGAAGNIAPPHGEICPARDQCGHYNASMDDITKAFSEGRDALKRAEKAEQRAKDAELKAADLESRMRDATERYWQPFFLGNGVKVPLKDVLNDPRGTLFSYRNGYRTTSQDDEIRDLKNQIDDLRSGNVQFCPHCGTNTKPEPHVPKWATEFFTACPGGNCQSCAKASRLRAILGYPYGCWDTGCEYEPRYTHAQRRAMSDKGKLKDVRAKLAAEVSCNDQNLTAWKKEVAGLKAEIEHIKKESVPLANAIKAIINTEKVETKDSSGDGWNWSTKMCQVLRVMLPEGMMVQPRDLVLYKKAKEEK